MKPEKALLAVLAIAVASTLTSCYSAEEDVPEEPSPTLCEVTLRHNAFNFYQEDYGGETRAALTDESAAKLKALTVCIYENENTLVFNETQYRKDFTSNPGAFGIFTTDLPEGNYTLVSVGYESEDTPITLNSPSHVILPKPFIDAWSATEAITASTAGSVNKNLDLVLAVTHIVLTSTDLPTEDAAYVRIHLSAGSGKEFDPYTRNSINTTTNGDIKIDCPVSILTNDDGYFVFDKSFLIPTTPTDINVSFDILDSNSTVLRSYDLGSFSFKRGGINRFTGPIFSAVGNFSFTATTNWVENESKEF